MAGKKSKKRVKVTPGGDNLGSSSKTTASRKLGTQHECKNPERVHAVEHGDCVSFPCGQDGCDATRFLLDTWQIVLDDEHGTDDDKRQRPPPITHGGVEKVLLSMGVDFEIPQQQGDHWRPNKQIVHRDKTRDRIVPTTKTFIEAWNAMKLADKMFCLRPPLPLPSWRLVASCDGAVMPVVHRQANTHTECLEFIINKALVDGKITQTHINKTVEEYGIMERPKAPCKQDATCRTLRKKLANAAAIDMQEAFQALQFNDPKQDSALAEQKFSPFQKLHAQTKEREGVKATPLRTDDERKSKDVPALVEAETMMARDDLKGQQSPVPVRNSVDNAKKNNTAVRAFSFEQL